MQGLDARRGLCLEKRQPFRSIRYRSIPLPQHPAIMSAFTTLVSYQIREENNDM